MCVHMQDENSLPEDEVLREQLLDDLNRDDIKDPIIKKRLLFVQSIKVCISYIPVLTILCIFHPFHISFPLGTATS